MAPICHVFELHHATPQAPTDDPQKHISIGDIKYFVKIGTSIGKVIGPSSSITLWSDQQASDMMRKITVLVGQFFKGDADDIIAKISKFAEEIGGIIFRVHYHPVRYNIQRECCRFQLMPLYSSRPRRIAIKTLTITLVLQTVQVKDRDWVKRFLTHKVATRITSIFSGNRCSMSTRVANKNRTQSNSKTVQWKCKKHPDVDYILANCPSSTVSDLGNCYHHALDPTSLREHAWFTGVVAGVTHFHFVVGLHYKFTTVVAATILSSRMPRNMWNCLKKQKVVSIPDPDHDSLLSNWQNRTQEKPQWNEDLSLWRLHARTTDRVGSKADSGSVCSNRVVVVGGLVNFLVLQFSMNFLVLRFSMRQIQSLLQKAEDYLVKKLGRGTSNLQIFLAIFSHTFSEHGIAGS
ncbi:hypothetical protein BJ742DRAFT_745403 [Cladochytrium replicatum]|nr:hypothetical protein BJ742DRAFT_745403 [Cladochytrium replicatum]